MPDTLLLHVLAEIQRRGGIGRGLLVDEIAHARQYVSALPMLPGHLIDLGSGGGLPSLVIAVDAPAWTFALVERKEKRADLLRYGVRALGLSDRVDVVVADVSDARQVLGTHASVVTARSFAPPLTVLSTARGVLADGGMVLISDPPVGTTRWTPLQLEALEMVDLGRVGGIHRFLHCVA